MVYTDYCRQTGQRPKYHIEEWDRKKLIRDIFWKHYGKYASENDFQELSSAITYIKNMMLTDEQILEIERDYTHLSKMFQHTKPSFTISIKWTSMIKWCLR